MSVLITSSDLMAWLRETPAAMAYFESPECGVCRALRPKIELLLRESFPCMGFVVIDAGVSPESAVSLGVFSFPSVLVFFEGKEFLRRAGVVFDLAHEVERPYSIWGEGAQ